MQTILHSIGNTPLIELQQLSPVNGARVLVKMEGHNPTGSMKDRMARAVIEGALERGELNPDGTVVEYTGGSTGTSLAFVCAALGIKLKIVTSDAFSQEKRDHMRALGAEVIELESDGGKTTKALIERMIATAAELSEQPNCFFADQFNNPDAAEGYHSLADEIWQQTHGQVHAFVQSTGTAQCIKGVSERLHSIANDIAIHAVEPLESAVLTGGEAGSHKIEGVGPGFIPPMWDNSLITDIHQVSTAQAQQMSRTLAEKEALFAGTSTGANVMTALKLADKMTPEQTVVTLACDHGLKYLSTNLYRQSND